MRTVTAIALLALVTSPASGCKRCKQDALETSMAVANPTTQTAIAPVDEADNLRTIEFILARRDEEDLACASTQSFAGLRRGFQHPPVLRPISPLTHAVEAAALVPIMTTNHQLVLVPSPFDQPAISKHFRFVSDAIRFKVNCSYEMLVEYPRGTLDVRWKVGGPWMRLRANDGTVGRLSKCSVVEQASP